MVHFKTIRTYSQFGHDTISARLHDTNGISYVPIPVNTVIVGAELVHNGTPFVGYHVQYQGRSVYIRSADATEV